MKSAETVGIRWRTAKQLYSAYLKGCELEDGASAADIISACFNERLLEQSRIETFGRDATDHMLFRDAVQAIDERIERVRTSVMNIMRNEASTGVWLAIGRRGPDHPHELIPARYWPFLTIDIENNSALSNDSQFHQLRCATTAGVPSDHPLLVSFRSANQYAPGPRDTVAPATPPETPDLGRNGAPGRPSYIHLIEAEFKRRQSDNRLESSLTKEANALVDWFRSAHPEIKPYKAKSIYNRLGSLYRAAKSKP